MHAESSSLFRDPRMARIAAFLGAVGIETRPDTLSAPTFFPGIRITDGVLVIDETKDPQPGDLLHEAGHLAVLPPERRALLDGRFEPEPGEAGGVDMAATAWSYAAGVAIGFDPSVVFYPGSFKGEGEHLAVQFASGRYFGVPLLQWYGMTYESERAEAAGVEPYPHMIRWLRT